MARSGLRYLPKHNPCAQCGQPIAAPDWVEDEEDRTTYLWSCRACNYSFEAIAFFKDTESQSRRLAA
jgi:ribosomal protein L37AE/L43A